MTTEHDLWVKYKPAFRKAGLPTRTENAAATSLPDSYIACPLYTIYIELKIVKSHKVFLPKYQFAYGRELCNIVNSNLFWLLYDYSDTVFVTKYIDFVPAVKPSYNNLVEADMRTVPRRLLTNTEAWLHEIRRSICKTMSNLSA